MSKPMTLDEMTRLSWLSSIDFFLANYPTPDEEIDDLLEMIENLDNRIMVWEPFETWDGAALIAQIELHQRHLLNDFKRVAGTFEAGA